MCATLGGRRMPEREVFGRLEKEVSHYERS